MFRLNDFESGSAIGIISMDLPQFLKPQTDGAVLSIKLQPKSSVTQIGNEHGGMLRVKVTAPPVDGAANEALIKLLAGKLGCARSQVTIVRGVSSREKVVRVEGLSVEAILEHLAITRF